MEEEKKPERIKLPRWFTPVATAIVIGAGGIMYENHNKWIIVQRDVAYLLRESEATNVRQRTIRSDLDKKMTSDEDFHRQVLGGLTELVQRKEKR